MNRGALSDLKAKPGRRAKFRRPNRTQLGVMAVVFVLLVAGGEVLALKVGSFDLPLPSDSPPAVADHPKH